MTRRVWFFLGMCSVALLAQNVGIGTILPTERLHVAGNLRLEGAFMPGNDPGVSGQVLMSRGANTPPIWRSLWILWAIDAWNPSSTTSLGWSCTGCNGSSPWLSNCGSNLRMLGGYNICGLGCYFEKIFTGLPSHSEVFIEVRYYPVDSWDQNSLYWSDHIQISIDGTAASRCYPYEFGNTGPGYPGSPPGGLWTDSSPCGSGIWQDLGPYVCVAHASHTSSSLTVRIQSGLDQGASDESLGIVSVKIYIKQ
jgi:hypothetical protein